MASKTPSKSTIKSTSTSNDLPLDEESMIKKDRREKIRSIESRFDKLPPRDKVFMDDHQKACELYREQIKIPENADQIRETEIPGVVTLIFLGDIFALHPSKKFKGGKTSSRMIDHYLTLLQTQYPGSFLAAKMNYATEIVHQKSTDFRPEIIFDVPYVANVKSARTHLWPFYAWKNYHVMAVITLQPYQISIYSAVMEENAGGHHFKYLLPRISKILDWYEKVGIITHGRPTICPGYKKLRDEIIEKVDSGIYILKAAAEIAAEPRPQHLFLYSTEQFRNVILYDVISAGIHQPYIPLELDDNGQVIQEIINRYEFLVELGNSNCNRAYSSKNEPSIQEVIDQIKKAGGTFAEAVCSSIKSSVKEWKKEKMTPPSSVQKSRKSITKKEKLQIFKVEPKRSRSETAITTIELTSSPETKKSKTEVDDDEEISIAKDIENNIPIYFQASDEKPYQHLEELPESYWAAGLTEEDRENPLYAVNLEIEKSRYGIFAEPKLVLQISPSNEEISTKKLEFYDELAELGLVEARQGGNPGKNYIDQLDDLMKCHLASIYFKQETKLLEGFPIPKTIEQAKLESAVIRTCCLLCGRFFKDQRDLKLHLRNSAFPRIFNYTLPNGVDHPAVNPLLESKYLIPLYGSPMTEEEIENFKNKGVKSRRNWDEAALQSKRNRLNKIRTKAARKSQSTSTEIATSEDSMPATSHSIKDSNTASGSKTAYLKTWDELIREKKTAYHLLQKL